MMNKILIIDEEKWYMEAIFDRIDMDFGPNMYDYVFNGAEALRLLRTNKYSTIILDMMLPLGDGLELPSNEPDLMYGIYILRKIRELDNRTPIICYTVLNEMAIKQQISSYNAVHICKVDEESYDKLFKELKRLNRSK